MCGSDVGGSCYSALAFVAYDWDTSSDAGARWQHVFDKDEQIELSAAGLPEFQLSRKQASDLFAFRLLWRFPEAGQTTDDNAGAWQTSNSETPPAGLVTAGEGADPGFFDVDSETGSISALPRRIGNFSMYLIVVDLAGTAASLGLPAELDQVVVKRWDFMVVSTRGTEADILFNKLDVDNDGILSAAEISKGLSRVLLNAAADGDNGGGGGGGGDDDGNVEEWSHVVDTLIQAGGVDTSSDGTLSTEEFVAFFDANGDYDVTRKEFGIFLDALVPSGPSVDNDDGNAALIQDDDGATVPAVANKSKKGMIIGVVVAVVLLVAVAVLVYTFCIAAEKEGKIPRTLALSSTGRAIANPMYAGVGFSAGTSGSAFQLAPPQQQQQQQFAVPSEDGQMMIVESGGDEGGYLEVGGSNDAAC